MADPAGYTKWKAVSAYILASLANLDSVKDALAISSRDQTADKDRVAFCHFIVPDWDKDAEMTFGRLAVYKMAFRVGIYLDCYKPEERNDRYVHAYYELLEWVKTTITNDKYLGGLLLALNFEKTNISIPDNTVQFQFSGTMA
jgi:hypothetical protein